jgi:hypothetical protein
VARFAAAGYALSKASLDASFSVYPCGEIREFALQAPPSGADQTRSPTEVSQKREFFKHEPETIAKLGERMPQIGAWRLEVNSQKPANGGPFCEDQEPFL